MQTIPKPVITIALTNCRSFSLKRGKTYLLYGFIALLVMSVQARKGFTVAVNMIDKQRQYFIDSIITPFAKEQKCDIQVIDFKKNSDIDNLFQQLPKRKDGKKHKPLGLIKIPHQMAMSYIKQGHLIAINSFLSKKEIEDIEETYFLIELFVDDGNYYLVPRKLETRLMVYRKSKVDDVIANASKIKTRIHNALKEINGVGLPKGYKLEKSPGLWNFYDLFVVGYYWKHHPDNSGKTGRIAHRGKKYHGTVTGLLDKIVQVGSSDNKSMLNFSNNKVIEVFFWEALMVREGLYNAKMWKEGWSGTDIWQAFKDNEIYLSFMTQIDCHFLLGGENKTDPYIQPNDFGIAVMPAGCSFALDDTGSVSRSGWHAVSTGGWWWGIPKDAKYPKLSYNLIRHITSLEVQKKECGKFGMIPVRMEMFLNPENFFVDKYQQKIHNISKVQLINNSTNTVPLLKNYTELEQVFLDAWYSVCVDGYHETHRELSVEKIRTELNNRFNSRLKSLQE